MSETAHKLLAAFGALPLSDKQVVAAEILRRAGADDGLSEDGLQEVAVELFRAYDAEEAARGDR
jgi:hypothetical protein